MADTNAGRKGKKQVAICMNAKDWKQLDVASALSGLSKSELMRKAIRFYLKRRKELHLPVADERQLLVQDVEEEEEEIEEA